jgi:hypothetical protein
MRLLRVLVALSCVASLDACAHDCNSANAAPPATAEPRFVVASSTDTVAHVDLLSLARAVDGMGHPLEDSMHHALLDPNPDSSTMPAQSVARIDSFTIGGAASTRVSWLDERSRWTYTLHDAGVHSEGRGIGTSPVLPPAPPPPPGMPADRFGGPFVAIGGASSIVRFALGASYEGDAGVTHMDAGVDLPQRRQDWEWVPAAGTPMPGSTDVPAPPQLYDLVVVPRQLPLHDLVFVSRVATRDMAGQLVSGGDLLVLDIDDPVHVVSLGTVSLANIADPNMEVVPTGLAYMHGVVYVVLDHAQWGLMGMRTNGPGLVALVDLDQRTVQTLLRSTVLTACSGIAPFVPAARTATDPRDVNADHRLVVTCAGTAPSTIGTPTADAGFIYVEDADPAHPTGAVTPSIADTFTCSALGAPRPDGGSMALFDRWMAYVTLGSTSPLASDRVMAVYLDPEHGHGATFEIGSTAATSGTNVVGYGPGAFDADSGVLVVPHGFEGVDTWEIPRAYSRLVDPHFSFPEAITRSLVGTSGCRDRLPARTVRLVAARPTQGAATATDGGMPNDGGMPTDGGPSDGGMPSDAGVMDAGPVDAAMPHDMGVHG